jgi:hypothetical protein
MRAAALALLLTACAVSREPLEAGAYAGTLTVEASDEIGPLPPESREETVTIAEDDAGLYVVASCPLRLDAVGAVAPARCDLVAEGGTPYTVEVLGGEAMRSGATLTLRYDTITTSPRARAEAVWTFVGERVD